MYPWRTEKVGGDQAHHMLDDGATSGKVNVDRQKDRRRDLRACLVITDTDINLATSLHATSKDVIDPQEKRTERLPPSKRAVFLDASLPSRSVVSGNI